MIYTTTDLLLVETAYARVKRLYDAAEGSLRGAASRAADEKFEEVTCIYENCISLGEFSYAETLVAIHLMEAFLSTFNIDIHAPEGAPSPDWNDPEYWRDRDYPEEAGLYDVMMYER